MTTPQTVKERYLAALTPIVTAEPQSARNQLRIDAARMRAFFPYLSDTDIAQILGTQRERTALALAPLCTTTAHKTVVIDTWGAQPVGGLCPTHSTHNCTKFRCERLDQARAWAQKQWTIVEPKERVHLVFELLNHEKTCADREIHAVAHCAEPAVLVSELARRRSNDIQALIEVVGEHPLELAEMAELGEPIRLVYCMVCGVGLPNGQERLCRCFSASFDVQPIVVLPPAVARFLTDRGHTFGLNQMVAREAERRSWSGETRAAAVADDAGFES